MVVPQLNINRTGSLISGSVFGAGLITKYINNPERDFIGWNTGGQLNLVNAARQVSQRITLLTVRGTYRNTPATTGFGASGGGLGLGFGSISGAPLEAGQVTNRASRQIYTLGVAGGYQLTGVTSLIADYNYTSISFGEQSGVNNPLFDTTIHRASTTLSTMISARDTVGATAAMAHTIQEQSSGGSGQGTYTTITETLNWRRRWTEELTTTLMGGGTLKLPVGSAIPGQSSQSQIRPTVAAILTYRSFSEELLDAGAASPTPLENTLPSLAGSLAPGGIVAPGAYTASLSYRLSLVPSVAFGAGPQQTHVVGATSSAGITPRLTGQVGVNYAHGIKSAPTSTSDTLGVTAGARYLLGPVLASLTYSYFFFSRETEQSLSTPSSEYEYSKRMLLLSFSYAFVSPDFFREGISIPSFGGTGSSPSGDGSEILRKE